VGVLGGLFILNQRVAPPIIDKAIKIQNKNYEVVTQYSRSHNYDVSCGFLYGFLAKVQIVADANSAEIQEKIEFEWDK